jgi:RHS repeat-associated protein
MFRISYLALILMSVVLCLSWSEVRADSRNSTSKKKEKADLGTRDFSNESQFTGDVAFSIPIANQGGVAVALRYNSNVHKSVIGENKFSSSGWVGLGWSLALGSIQADINNTRDPADDKYFFVGPEGTSELIRDSLNQFMLREYRHWKITREVSGGSVIGWTVVLEDGTIQRYGNYNRTTSAFVLGYDYTNATRCFLGWGNLVETNNFSATASATLIPYQWDLADVETVSGDHTTIHYQQIQGSLTGTALLFTKESYPLDIVDRAGRKTEFSLYSTPLLGIESSVVGYGQSKGEARSLRYILLKDSVGTLISGHEFLYDSMNVLYRTSTNNKKLYLKKISDLDASMREVRRTDFEYAGVSASLDTSDHNPGALKKITLPEGGSIEYTYQASVVITDRTSLCRLGGNYFSTYFWRGLAADPEYWSVSGSDFFVIRRDNYLEAYRWGANNRFSLDASFPLSEIYDPWNTRYWVYNDYVVVLSGSVMRVAKRKGDVWLKQVLELTVSNAQCAMVGFGMDYFVYAWGCDGNTPYSPDQGFVRVATFVNDSVWINQDLGQHWIGSQTPFISGTRFFTIGAGNTGVMLWDDSTHSWTNSRFPDDYYAAGRDYLITCTSTGTINVLKVNGSGWNADEVSWQSILTPSGVSVFPGENFFVFQPRSALNYAHIATPTSTGWIGTPISGLYSATIDEYTSFAVGPDFVALSWLDRSNNYWNIGVIKYKNGQWQQGTTIRSVSIPQELSGWYRKISISGSTIFAEEYRPMSKLQVLALNERNGNWLIEELMNLTLGYLELWPSGLKPIMQPGLSFNVCVLDSVVAGSYSEGMILAWKRSYTPDFRETFADTSMGGYDFRVVKKRVFDGRGGLVETAFSYERGSYDEAITTARYNKCTRTPTGANGSTITLFYNDMGPGDAEEFVSVPDFEYLDGMEYKKKVCGIPPIDYVEREDNAWGVTFINPVSEVESLNPVETSMPGYWATTPASNPLWSVLDDGTSLDTNDYVYTLTEGDVFEIRMQSPSNPLDPAQSTDIAVDARTRVNGQMGTFKLVIREVKNGVSTVVAEPSFSVPSLKAFQSFSTSVSNSLLSNHPDLYVSIELYVGLVEVSRIRIDTRNRILKGPYLSHLAESSTTRDGVAIEKSYDYCSSNGLVSRITETNSDGSVRYTDTKYAHERSSYSAMAASEHMLSQPYSTTVLAGSDVEVKKWTLWSAADGIWRPREEWRWKGDGSASDQTAPEDPDGSPEAFKVASYESYDQHGNLIQARDANGVPATTQWGYSSSVPIGQVKNVIAGSSFISVFDDGNIANWSGSGTWSIVNGAYQQSAGTITTPWFTPRVYDGLGLVDGVVEGDVRFDNAGDYRYAAIGKSVDATHEILFELRKTDNAAWIEVIVNGVAVATATAPYSYSENTWYHVRGEFIGTQAKMFVNGLLMCTLNNANVNIGSGKVGLATYRTVASFDNVRFHAPNVLATVQSYDPVTLTLTTLSDENGDLTRLSYDGIGRKIKAFAGTSGSASIIAENRFHYSRSLDGAFSTLHPNSVETVLYADAAGFSDFLSSSGWTYSGDITFNSQMGGERTVRMGTLSGAWDYILKQAPTGHALARVDFYPDNTTGGTPYAISFEDASYRIAVRYHPETARFEVQKIINGSPSCPLTFSLPAPANAWYTVELEKTDAGEVYAFVYPKGQGRIYQTGYMFTSGGYPTNWTPVVISWANDDYFYLANHYVGLYDRNVTFFDGYGRPIQEQKQLKERTIVASSSTYDSLGRMLRVYKPFEKDFAGSSRHRYDSTFAVDADSYYNAMDVAESHTDGFPFSETRYFTDPLARPQKQSFPGTAWRIGSGREVKSEYLANSGSDVPGYSSPTLNKLRQLDEDSTISDTFTDKFGQTVASTLDPTGLNLRTLFKYDVAGNLIHSITPREDTTRYTYNPAGKLAQKSTPDQGTTHYLYDKNGNVRLVKDAAHTGTTANSVNITPPGGYIEVPNTASGQFTISMPGRVTITTLVYDIELYDYITVRVKANGVIVCTTSSSMWSGSSNSIILPKGTYQYEVQTYGSYGAFGYSVVCNTGFEFVYYKYDPFNRLLEMGEYESSSTSANFTTANAENSAFPSTSYMVTSAFAYDTPATEPLAAGQRNLKGRVSSATSYRQGAAELNSYYSYDEYGNTEWVLQKNSAGKWWQLKEDHDLQGRVTKKHYIDGTSSANNLFTQFTYDQAGHLLKVTTGPTLAKIDSVQEALYTYYAGGTVKRLQQASSQGVDYRYNPRDWLRQINHQNLGGIYQGQPQDPGRDGFDSGLPVDRFGMVFGYENVLYHIGDPQYQNATPRWNGNITWAIYSMYGVPFNGTILVGNTYSYDKANRITGENFGYYTTSWLSTPAFDESGYSYDANGNILTLQRYGNTGGQMDNLTYAYTAGKNRLRHVNDTVSPSAFTTDIDQQVTDNYAYDDNGSVQKDDQRDIGFVVNDIRNLPVSVWKQSTGQELRYYYDVEGRRIRKDAGITEYYVNSPEGNTEAVVKSDITQATHNIWGLDNLGQVKRSGSSWSRYYYLKDHLGTVKMTVDGTGTVVGWDDFYPFGMQMEGRSQAAGADPRYKYTSKERDAESGIDYFGARYYDARIGRWLTVDPLAEKYPGWSPCNYAGNNPIVRRDANGDTVSFADENLRKQHEDYYNRPESSRYREQHDRLNASDVMYTVTTGDLGGAQDGKMKLGDTGTKEGRTVTITLDVANGATMNNLSHEFVHGIQFEEGRIYFWRENTSESWGTVGMTIGIENEAFRGQQNPTILTESQLNTLYPDLMGKKGISQLTNFKPQREVWREPTFFGVIQPKK